MDINSPRERRQALLSGSAAGLAAAFICPLAGVAFIIEEIANPFPITISGWQKRDLEKLLKSCSFDEFPFMTDNTVTGIVDRKQLEYFLKTGELVGIVTRNDVFRSQAKMAE